MFNTDKEGRVHFGFSFRKNRVVNTVSLSLPPPPSPITRHAHIHTDTTFIRANHRHA